MFIDRIKQLEMSYRLARNDLNFNILHSCLYSETQRY